MNSVTLFNFSNPQHTIYKAILQGYELDEHFLDQNAIRNYHKSSSGFFIKNFGGKRLCVVPNISSIREHILFVNHSIPLAGHPGIDKTFELVTRYFW